MDPFHGTALSPPPSHPPSPSPPCPPLIAPLILAPLRNRLDDVPFRLNFFLGGRAVRAVWLCCSSQISSPVQATQSGSSKFECNHTLALSHFPRLPPPQSSECRVSLTQLRTPGQSQANPRPIQANQTNQTPALQKPVGSYPIFSPERGRRQIPISFLGPIYLLGPLDLDSRDTWDTSASTRPPPAPSSNIVINLLVSIGRVRDFFYSFFSPSLSFPPLNPLPPLLHKHTHPPLPSSPLQLITHEPATPPLDPVVRSPGVWFRTIDDS